MSNVNTLSERLIQIRAERGELKAKDDELKQEYDGICSQIIGTMDELGVESTRSDHASMSKSIQKLPHVKDWQAFYDYVKKNDAFYLLQQRVSSKAWSELVELEGEIPGTEAYEKVKLNVRVRT